VLVWERMAAAVSEQIARAAIDERQASIRDV
jgi:hypothetical protein